MELDTWKYLLGKEMEAVKVAIDFGYQLLHWLHSHVLEGERGGAGHLGEAQGAGSEAWGDLFIVSKLWSMYHNKNLVRGAFQKTLSNLELD